VTDSLRGLVETVEKVQNSEILENSDISNPLSIKTLSF
jgi:hypothetical protein